MRRRGLSASRSNLGAVALETNISRELGDRQVAAARPRPRDMLDVRLR